MDIKALRKELGYTAKELARALEVDAATVLAWEQGELFPTKRYVRELDALRARGSGAMPRSSGPPAENPLAALADPTLWSLLRKLIAHPTLRRDVAKLAATYSDPAEKA